MSGMAIGLPIKTPRVMPGSHQSKGLREQIKACALKRAAHPSKLPPSTTIISHAGGSKFCRLVMLS